MLRGVLVYTRRYFTGDALERRRVRYEAGLRLRGIDTSHVDVDELGLSADRAKPHSASGGPDLEDVLKALGLPRGVKALDLGCGKGGALLTLAESFDCADGVDISPEMLAIAGRNLKKRRVRSRLMQADAAEFDGYDPYNLVYMFNPFPAAVMAAAMGKLARSLARAPRPFHLIYKNPRYHDAVTAAGLRSVREFPCGDLPFRVYAPKNG